MHTIFPNWPIQSPQFINDPYPFYRERREISPIGQTRAGPWCLTGYDVIEKVLRHPDIGVHKAQHGLVDENSSIRHLSERWVIFCDPPVHTRIRRLVGQSFHRLVKEEAKSIITEVLDNLLTEFENKREIEFINEFAYPLPLYVILKLIGVPAEDWARVTEWVKPLAVMIDPYVSTPYSFEQIETAASSLNDYLTLLTDNKRKQPSQDVISHLTHDKNNGDQLSTEDLISNISFLLFAGHETTVNLLGNGLYAALKDQTHWKYLVHSPEKIPLAVEELLRYDSPIQLTIKRALKDIKIGGCAISAGSELRLFLGAANRDPDHFENPEQLMLDRSPNPHLAFGKGDHSCMGTTLARLEGKMAFEMLVQNFPKMELIESAPPRKIGLNLRGLARLPLSLGR
ncbi:MAG: cytochrome P450 [Verrucomicrobia bacterium]|nr:cytochrome P450 [Verrucomicrobiota bacterium]